MPFISSSFFRNSTVSSKHPKTDPKTHDQAAQDHQETIRTLREENDALKAVLANPTGFTDAPENLSDDTKVHISGIKIRCQVFHTEIANMNKEIMDLTARNAELERKIAANRFYLDDLSRQRIEVQRLQAELATRQDYVRRCGIAEAEVQRLQAELAAELAARQDYARRCDNAEAEVQRLQAELTAELAARQDYVRRCGNAEAEVQRLQPFEVEARRLAPFEQEANRLRPQIGYLRDTIRETDRSKRVAEEKVLVTEAESRMRALRFAHIQQLLVETRAMSKRVVSPHPGRGSKDKSNDKQIRDLQLQLTGSRAQISRLISYKAEANRARHDTEELRERLIITQGELDTSKSFVHALQKRLQRDAFSSVIEGVEGLR